MSAPNVFLHKAGPRVVTGSKGGVYEVQGLPKVSPRFRNRAEAEKWMRAEVSRLPEANKPRARACMCCGTSFESQHIGHRLCQHCRHRGDGSSMGVATNSTGKVRRAAKA